MGTPAKSARLQLLQGNPAKKNTKKLKERAKQEEKMKMSADSVVPPSFLDKTGKKEFERLAELLLSVELINNADILHLAMYCDAYSRYLSYGRQVKSKGLWVDGKPNSFILRQNEASAQMRSYAADLGLSPSARAKLAINLDGDNDDDDDF